MSASQGRRARLVLLRAVDMRRAVRASGEALATLARHAALEDRLALLRSAGSVRPGVIANGDFAAAAELCTRFDTAARAIAIARKQAAQCVTVAATTQARATAAHSSSADWHAACASREVRDREQRACDQAPHRDGGRA